MTAVIILLGRMLATGTSARADSPSLILSVDDEITRPGTDSPVAVHIQNLSDTIFAFQMLMRVDRSDLIHFPGTLTIKSCLECADSACTSTVSVPCTVYVAPVTRTNTLIEHWDYVEARVEADTQIRVTAISNFDFNPNGPYIVPGTEGTLLSLTAHAVCEVSDTLSNRTAMFTFDSTGTRFSNMVAELIDSTVLDSGAVTVGFNDCGDMNGDGVGDAVDLNELIETLFFNGTFGCPARVSDMDCNGTIDAVDLNYLIGLLFFNGPDCPC